jgi:acyl carrier protein
LPDPRLLEAKQFLIEALRIPELQPSDLADDLSLFGDGLGLDSIDALALVVALRKKYGIDVKDAEAGRVHFQNVRTLADLIASGKDGESRVD